MKNYKVLVREIIYSERFLSANSPEEAKNKALKQPRTFLKFLDEPCHKETWLVEEIKEDNG